MKHRSMLRCLSIALCATLFAAVIAAQNGGSIQAPYVKCWEVFLDNSLPFPAVTGNGSVFFPQQDGSITALDARTGKVLWLNELGGAVVSNIAYRDGQLFVVSNPSGNETIADKKSILWMLNPESGLTISSSTLPFADRFFLQSTEKYLVVVGEKGTITVIGNESQPAKWSKSLDSQISTPPAVSDNRLAIGTEDGRLMVIDLDTGAYVLQRQWRNGITAILVVGPDEFVIGDDRGTVVSFNSASASMWQFKTGASISNISPAGNAIAVISLDNFLYLISVDRGKVKWRKRLAGRTLYTPLILRDRIIAATHGENSIPFSDIRNGKTVNRIELDEGTYFTQSPQMTGDGAFIVTMPGSIVLLNDQPCRPE